MGSSHNTNECCGGTCGTGAGSAAGQSSAQAATRRVVFTPAVDVIETPTEYQVKADVPGTTPEQVEVTLEEGVLSVRAGVSNRHEHIGGFISREYGVGSYERSFRVGEGIDPETISADLKHGVLTVKLPKAAEARPRRISVSTN